MIKLALTRPDKAPFVMYAWHAHIDYDDKLRAHNATTTLVVDAENRKVTVLRRDPNSHSMGVYESETFEFRAMSILPDKEPIPTREVRIF